MNKLCKEYINEIKAMFPVKGKEERKYIKNLSYFQWLYFPF